MSGDYLGFALFAAALALVAIGATTAWTSSNLIKRVVGLMLAQFGAALAALALGAAQGLAFAAIAAALGGALLGAAFWVRAQEAYRSVEGDEIDAADRQSEERD